MEYDIVTPVVGPNEGIRPGNLSDTDSVYEDTLEELGNHLNVNGNNVEDVPLLRRSNRVRKPPERLNL